jgi:diguanylate cyclase (GGDEF)-like protein
VNDGLGHDAGDSLLTTIARRLRPVVRRGDLIARVGGDEFASLVSRLTSADELRETCGTVLACLKEPFVHQGCVFDCRVSIGAALYPDHGKSAKALLKSADTALYAAKKESRARALTFAPEMRSELDRRTAMINLAREALARDDIVPHYQPKICLQTGAVKGFEALLRWRDTGGAIQLPAAIAAAFDDREISQALSERMQDRVIADMRRWLDEGLAFGGVAINAAAAEFRRNDFAERLLAKLGATDVPARYLELEVTETVFLGRGADHVERALGLLSAAGIRIALDDFGTGYASLSHLKKFPVDVIKIDQSFVRDLEFDENDAAIVRALLSLGSNLGIETVAEGIENPRQADFLMRHGCGLGQGYLFSKAIAAAEIPAMLLNGQWVVQK